MKLITASIGAALLLGIGGKPGLAQESTSPERQGGVMESVTRKATVQDIDRKNRTVTLKGESGKVFTVHVGEEAKNFDQIKKGDLVTARYTESLALAIRKSGEPPTASEQEAMATAQPGEKPAGIKVETTQLSATVEKIDRDSREVTLRGPEGKTKKLKVGKDVEAFDKLKEGDQVVATFTEAFSIRVTSPQE